MTREVKLVSNEPQGGGVRIPLKAALLSDLIKEMVNREANTLVFALPVNERELRALAEWLVNHQHDDPPTRDYHKDTDVIPYRDMQIFNIVPPKQLARAADKLRVPGLVKLCQLVAIYDDKYNHGRPFRLLD